MSDMTLVLDLKTVNNLGPLQAILVEVTWIVYINVTENYVSRYLKYRRMSDDV